MAGADTEKVVNWLECIARDATNLTPWEEQFVADMQDKVDKYGNRAMFTQAQADVVERIYTQRTP